MGLRGLSKGVFKGVDTQPYLHLPQSNPLRLPWDIGILVVCVQLVTSVHRHQSLAGGKLEGCLLLLHLLFNQMSHRESSFPFGCLSPRGGNFHFKTGVKTPREVW